MNLAGANCAKIWVKGGPDFSPLRFWVKTRDKVMYQEDVEKCKMLVASHKAEKSLTAQQADSMQKKVFLDHDKFGNHSLPTDMGSMAKQLQWQSADGILFVERELMIMTTQE